MAAMLGLLGLAACGDDDDDPGRENESPPTGANLSDEGNVDVTSSIADPAVVASNVGDIDPPANS